MKLLRFTFKTDIRVGLSERSSAKGARRRKSIANPMGGSTIVFIGRSSIQCQLSHCEALGSSKLKHVSGFS
jgi:hypothetical protein